MTPEQRTILDLYCEGSATRAATATDLRLAGVHPSDVDGMIDRADWIECNISDGMSDLHISHPPDADLDGAFAAYCHYTGETLRINGWQMSHYELITE